MGILKPKTEKTDHVTRQEFDALAAPVNGTSDFDDLPLDPVWLEQQASEGDAIHADAPQKAREITMNAKTDSVSRQEFDALLSRFEAFQSVMAIALSASWMAMAATPGLPDSNPRSRLVKLVRGADLDDIDSAQRSQLQNFLEVDDRMKITESRRAQLEDEARRRPPTFSTFRFHSVHR
jgi:hypothetical protein